MIKLLKYIIVFMCTGFLISACESTKESVGLVIAETSNFTHLNNSLVSIEKEIGVWGGGSKKKFRALEHDKCTYQVRENKLNLLFDDNGYFQMSPKALLLPLSWENADVLSLEIASNGLSELIVEIMGSRSRIQEKLSLDRESTIYTIDIREALLLGGLDNEVLKIKLIAPIGGNLALHKIQLLDTDKDQPLIDRWGQRNLHDYPNKINIQSQLNNFEKEEAFFAALSENTTTDDYGGFIEHNLPLKATGFFHTQNLNGKWYLVSPAGNPFYSLGLNGVRRKSTLNNAALTKVKNREEIFEELPSYENCPECFSEDSAYLSFYCYNVKRKYGEYTAWKEHVLKRLKNIGFNTIGNWSDSLLYNSAFPYTYTLDTRKGTGLEMSNKMPDVFHPDWERRLDASFSEITQFKEDSYLIGYFVDNEMGWRSINKWDSTSYTFTTLKDLPSEKAQKEAYAERYFSSLKKVLKKYAPNHLYLGCRFTRNFKGLQPVAAIAGKYVDVLSINVYSAVPIKKQMDDWYAAVQKPMIISEHHIPPATKRALLPIYPAFGLAQRDIMLEEYLRTWLTFPYAVGSHWYQYADQEVAGRMDGGENQPVGIVSVTDQIHEPIVRLYHKMAKEIAESYVQPLEQ